MTDLINNPPHYTRFTIEPIDVIEDWDLPPHLAAVVKYIARRDLKHDSPIQDLEKAEWYLARYIAFVKRRRGSRQLPAPVDVRGDSPPGEPVVDHSDR